MSQYDKETMIEEILPKGKETFSRDAVEILLAIAMEKGAKQNEKNQRADKLADERGDY